MLAPEDRPATHARVMKVTSKATSATPAPAPEPTPASAPTLAAPVQQKISNYEADFASSSSEDETSGTGTAGIKEDDGWDVVPSKKKSQCSTPLRLQLPTFHS